MEPPESVKVSEATVAIHLGNTSASIAIIDELNGNQIKVLDHGGSKTIPSVVSLQDNKIHKVGLEAEYDVKENFDRTFYNL